MCSCLTGNRTCGCCSHVAVLIYYLSYAKHQPNPLKSPGHSLNDILVVVDTDEDDNDDEIVDNNMLLNINSSIELTQEIQSSVSMKRSVSV